MNKASVYFLLKRRRLKERGKTSIGQHDSSSIADVAFLLLIFFIVTSSFFLPQGLFLRLPSDSAKSVEVKKKYIIDVYPNEENHIIDQKEYTDRELSDLLRRRIEKLPETVLIIHIKDDVPYARFIQTLNIARSARLNRISLKEDG